MANIGVGGDFMLCVVTSGGRVVMVVARVVKGSIGSTGDVTEVNL